MAPRRLAQVARAVAPTPAAEDDGEASSGGSASGKHTHFHLPDAIVDMTPEQLSSLAAGALEAAQPAAAQPAAAPPAADELGSEGPGIAADTEGLAGSEVEAWNSGGTAGALPAERAQASFTVEKMVRARPPPSPSPARPSPQGTGRPVSARARGCR